MPHVLIAFATMLVCAAAACCCLTQGPRLSARVRPAAAADAAAADAHNLRLL
jgi:hypothetical protein